MDIQEKIARLIIGAVLMFIVYSLITHFFSESGFSIWESLFVAFFWSIGMLIFENWYKKRQEKKNG